MTMAELADRDTRVLLAAAGGGRSVRTIGDRLNLEPSSVHASLARLRDRGLVTWTEGKHGTIHATVEIVAASPW